MFITIFIIIKYIVKIKEIKTCNCVATPYYNV